MNIPRGFLSAALFICLVAGTSYGTPFYTEIYTFSQGGFNFGGSLTGTFWIDEMDGDWVISSGDKIRGTLVFSVANYPDNGSYNLVRGFAISSIVGSSLLTGNYSILGAGGPGNGSVSVNPSGTTLSTYEYPLNGNFSVWQSTQAPTITRAIPDAGNITGIFAAIIGVLAIVGVRHRRRSAVTK